MELLEKREKSTRSGSQKLTVIIFLCFIASFIIAAFSIDWSTIPALLNRINWYVFPLIILCTCLSYWAAGQSFVYGCKLFRFTTPTHIIWKIGFLSTIADNIAMLGNVGGHSVRLLLLSKYKENPSEILGVSIFAGYFYQISFICFFPLSFVLLALDHTTSPFSSVTLILLSLFFIFVSVFLTLITFFPDIRNWTLRLLSKLIHGTVKKDINNFLSTLSISMKQGVISSREHPYELTMLITYTVADWLTNALATELCLLALGSYIAPGPLLLGFVVGITLGMLSFIPGGLGVQDGSMAGIYTLLGVPLRTSVLAIILFRILYYFIPYFLSIFIYRRVVQQAPPAGATQTYQTS